MKYSYQLIRSDRKSISLQILSDGSLLVRCPKNMTIDQVESFVKSKSGWLEKHLKSTQRTKQPPFTSEQIRQLAEQAAELIPARVAYYAPLVGVKYSKITIRNQRTRWGSCSGKGNLNFNCLLMLAPVQVLDYVVVHELCHIQQMNHSKAFWELVQKVIPDYKTRRKWLKENGRALIDRLA